MAQPQTFPSGSGVGLRFAESSQRALREFERYQKRRQAETKRVVVPEQRGVDVETSETLRALQRFQARQQTQLQQTIDSREVSDSFSSCTSIMHCIQVTEARRVQPAEVALQNWQRIQERSEVAQLLRAPARRGFDYSSLALSATATPEHIDSVRREIQLIERLQRDSFDDPTLLLQPAVLRRMTSEEAIQLTISYGLDIELERRRQEVFGATNIQQEWLWDTVWTKLRNHGPSILYSRVVCGLAALIAAGAITGVPVGSAAVTVAGATVGAAAQAGATVVGGIKTLGAPFYGVAEYALPTAVWSNIPSGVTVAQFAAMAGWSLVKRAGKELGAGGLVRVQQNVAGRILPGVGLNKQMITSPWLRQQFQRAKLPSAVYNATYQQLFRELTHGTVQLYFIGGPGNLVAKVAGWAGYGTLAGLTGTPMLALNILLYCTMRFGGPAYIGRHLKTQIQRVLQHPELPAFAVDPLAYTAERLTALVRVRCQAALQSLQTLPERTQARIARWSEQKKHGAEDARQLEANTLPALIRAGHRDVERAIQVAEEDFWRREGVPIQAEAQAELKIRHARIRVGPRRRFQASLPQQRMRAPEQAARQEQEPPRVAVKSAPLQAFVAMAALDTPPAPVSLQADQASERVLAPTVATPEQIQNARRIDQEMQRQFLPQADVAQALIEPNETWTKIQDVVKKNQQLAVASSLATGLTLGLLGAGVTAEAGQAIYSLIDQTVGFQSVLTGVATTFTSGKVRQLAVLNQRIARLSGVERRGAIKHMWDLLFGDEYLSAAKLRRFNSVELDAVIRDRGIRTETKESKIQRPRSRPPPNNDDKRRAILQAQQQAQNVTWQSLIQALLPRVIQISAVAGVAGLWQRGFGATPVQRVKDVAAEQEVKDIQPVSVYSPFGPNPLTQAQAQVLLNANPQTLNVPLSVAPPFHPGTPGIDVGLSSCQLPTPEAVLLDDAVASARIDQTRQQTAPAAPLPPAVQEFIRGPSLTKEAEAYMLSNYGFTPIDVALSGAQTDVVLGGALDSAIAAYYQRLRQPTETLIAQEKLIAAARAAEDVRTAETRVQQQEATRRLDEYFRDPTRQTLQKQRIQALFDASWKSEMDAEQDRLVREARRTQRVLDDYLADPVRRALRDEHVRNLFERTRQSPLNPEADVDVQQARARVLADEAETARRVQEAAEAQRQAEWQARFVRARARLAAGASGTAFRPGEYQRLQQTKWAPVSERLLWQDKATLLNKVPAPWHDQVLASFWKEQGRSDLSFLQKRERFELAFRLLHTHVFGLADEIRKTQQDVQNRLGISLDVRDADYLRPARQPLIFNLPLDQLVQRFLPTQVLLNAGDYDVTRFNEALSREIDRKDLNDLQKALRLGLAFDLSQQPEYAAPTLIQSAQDDAKLLGVSLGDLRGIDFLRNTIFYRPTLPLGLPAPVAAPLPTPTPAAPTPIPTPVAAPHPTPTPAAPTPIPTPVAAFPPPEFAKPIPSMYAPPPWPETIPAEFRTRTSELSDFTLLAATQASLPTSPVDAGWEVVEAGRRVSRFRPTDVTPLTLAAESYRASQDLPLCAVNVWEGDGRPLAATAAQQVQPVVDLTQAIHEQQARPQSQPQQQQQFQPKPADAVTDNNLALREAQRFIAARFPTQSMQNVDVRVAFSAFRAAFLAVGAGVQDLDVRRLQATTRYEEYMRAWSTLPLYEYGYTAETWARDATAHPEHVMQLLDLHTTTQALGSELEQKTVRAVLGQWVRGLNPGAFSPLQPMLTLDQIQTITTVPGTGTPLDASTQGVYQRILASFLKTMPFASAEALQRVVGNFWRTPSVVSGAGVPTLAQDLNERLFGLADGVRQFVHDPQTTVVMPGLTHVLDETAGAFCLNPSLPEVLFFRAMEQTPGTVEDQVLAGQATVRQEADAQQTQIDQDLKDAAPLVRAIVQGTTTYMNLNTQQAALVNTVLNLAEPTRQRLERRRLGLPPEEEPWLIDPFTRQAVHAAAAPIMTYAALTNPVTGLPVLAKNLADSTNNWLQVRKVVDILQYSLTATDSIKKGQVPPAPPNDFIKPIPVPTLQGTLDYLAQPASAWQPSIFYNMVARGEATSEYPQGHQFLVGAMDYYSQTIDALSQARTRAFQSIADFYRPAQQVEVYSAIDDSLVAEGAAAAIEGRAISPYKLLDQLAFRLGGEKDSAAVLAILQPLWNLTPLGTNPLGSEALVDLASSAGKSTWAGWKLAAENVGSLAGTIGQGALAAFASTLGSE